MVGYGIKKNLKLSTSAIRNWISNQKIHSRAKRMKCLKIALDPINITYYVRRMKFIANFGKFKTIAIQPSLHTSSKLIEIKFGTKHFITMSLFGFFVVLFSLERCFAMHRNPKYSNFKYLVFNAHAESMTGLRNVIYTRFMLCAHWTLQLCNFHWDYHSNSN